jgi:hypothetical protein
MNILYIIGNGFDLAQGMETSYTHFYQYLKDRKCSPLLELMKKYINSNQELWSDMEEGLGEFTLKVDEPTDLEKLRHEINENLQTYLRSQCLAFSPNQEQKNDFLKDFTFVGRHINPYGDINLIKSFKDNYKVLFNRGETRQRNINVMTFNYTDTLEKLFNLDSNKLPMDLTSNSRLIDICHVHGRLGETIIFGVDNLEQIKNPMLKDNECVNYCMVKKATNMAINSFNFSICENLIKEANLIILFGVSLGDTDLRWWKLIGEETKKRKDIIIIDYLFSSVKISKDRQYLKALLENERRKKIIKQMMLDEATLQKRLFFITDSQMFKASVKAI